MIKALYNRSVYEIALSSIGFLHDITQRHGNKTQRSMVQWSARVRAIIIIIKKKTILKRWFCTGHAM